MKKWVDSAKKNYKRLIVLLVGLLLLYFVFGPGFAAVVVMIVFILIGMFSTFYQNFFKSPINFEMVKFVTVLTSVAYGPIPGMLVGMISSFIGKLISGRLEADSFVSLIAIAIISFLAYAFRSMDIVMLGMLMVVLYHLIIFPAVLMLGGTMGYGIIYSGSNIIFNLIIFSYLGRFVLSLIT